MLTAGEYFTKVYSSVMKPIIVCDGNQQVVYFSSGAAVYMDQPLPKQVLQEAMRCIESQHGLSLSLAWGERVRMTHFVPAVYQDEFFAVIEIPVAREYPELPELLTALTNIRGKLAVCLDTIYFVAQQMGFSDKYGKELGYEVRRILRMMDHLDRLAGIGDRAFYRVPMNLNQFVINFAQGVHDLEICDSISVETENEVLIARIMPEDMELVLSTLVSNAFRFGGENAVIRTSGDQNTVRITVVDRGPGVQEPDRLFNCGYRTRDAIGGEGLGISLAMAKQLLACQDATLRYERVNNESLFHIEMDAVPFTEGIRLGEWKPEPLENTLSQLRVELSDYMIAMDFKESLK